MPRIITLVLLFIGPLFLTGYAVAADMDDGQRGEIYVHSMPPGAEVLVDGESLGKTDDLFEVSSGRRKVEVKLDGYETRQKTVTVPATRIKRVEFELKRQVPSNNPRPIKIFPQIGATDVDPGIKEISATFDRDMNTDSFSWCGGGPNFPKATGKPKWIDRRTCVLPVELEVGRAYRLALNWGRFQGFRSADGLPAVPTAVYFCTRGAGPKLVAQMTPPKVVKLNIENGAKNVPPGRTKLSVTFDQKMGGGMSWCTGPDTPEYEAVKGSAWSEDGKTCSIYALLEPARNYTVYLNGQRFGNFANELGVPLRPTSWKFTTAE